MIPHRGRKIVDWQGLAQLKIVLEWVWMRSLEILWGAGEWLSLQSVTQHCTVPCYCPVVRSVSRVVPASQITLWEWWTEELLISKLQFVSFFKILHGYNDLYNTCLRARLQPVVPLCQSRLWLMSRQWVQKLKLFPNAAYFLLLQYKILMLTRILSLQSFSK